MTQADKSVFLREKYFTDIYNNIPVAEALFDLDGNLTDMNDAFIDTFALVNKEDSIGKNLFKDVNFPQNFKEMIFSSKKNSFHQKYSFLKADQFLTTRTDIADMNFRTVKLYDSSGKNDAFLFIAIEETEHVRNLERISHFQEIISLVNEFAKIGYAKINRFDKTGIANKEWFLNLGEDPDTSIKDILGVFAHVHSDDRVKIKDYCKGIADGTCKGYKLDYRIEVKDRPDKWRWIQAIVQVTYYHPEEGIINTLWANFDVTDFKEVEAELREAKEKAEMADQLKSAFLANISHEIRTPLNAIVGFSELMKTSEDAKEKEQYSQIIAQNNELLLRLIGDVLDLSKIESGMMDFKDEPFDICEVLDEIYLTMLQRFSKTNIKLLKHCPYCHCIVKLDKNRFKQVWWNFLTNAAKYTVKGHILVGFDCENDGVRIYVEDSGIGVAKDKQDKVFHRFQKLDDFAQGTGLGLSISKAITDRYKGKIGFESIQGKGSTFWAWFPCAMEITKANNNILDKNMISEESSPQTSDVRKPEGCKILVAEDIDSNYLLVRAILRSCSLSRAINGKEAVEFAQNNKYDVILMDIKMPIMDGLEATRKIREFDKDTPIIALTANAFDSDKVDALAAGCDAYIAKPIKKAELEKTIKESYMKHNQDK